MVPRSAFYKSVYDQLDVDKQENIKSVIYLKFSCLFVDWQSQWGAFGSREWHANASPEALEQQKEAGRNFWATLTEQEQEEMEPHGGPMLPCINEPIGCPLRIMRSGGQPCLPSSKEPPKVSNNYPLNANDLLLDVSLPNL